MNGKAFIRKFPTGDGNSLTMLVMLTYGLESLDDETLYVFDVTDTDETILLRPIGKRQTDEMRGCTAQGIVGKL